MRQKVRRELVWFRIFLLLLCCAGQVSVLAQSPSLPVNDDRFFLNIRKAETPVVIDGRVDEAAWQQADALTGFHQVFPFDSGKAQQQTIARVTYDDEFLYISGVCYQNSYVVNSLRRDFDWGGSDIFFIVLDPFRDKLNGFYFAVTPYGVQKEALLANAGERNADWDNRWYSESSRHADRYEVEMAIPFKTLRFKIKPGEQPAWNINFCRNNLALNERSAWAPVPRNQSIIDLAFCGRMFWEEALPKPGANVVLIPYGLASADKNFEAKTPTNSTLNAGLDAKIGITPSLNLDLTVNPDFAQVEVDRQVTNLSRFELFFPERRQFFLENADVFGSFGFGNINPFFSRRIGLGRNENNGENVRIPILFGARLSGRVNRNWRIGLMNITTAESERFGVPATNYMVLSAQRRIGLRNNLSAILVSKDPMAKKDGERNYNRVAGLDFNFASANSQLVGKVFYHQGFSPSGESGQQAMGATAAINTLRWDAEASISNVGRAYRPEVGFAPRRDIVRSNGQLNRVFFAKNKLAKHVNRFYLGPDFDIVYGKGDGRVLDWDAGLFFGIDFQNSAQIRGALARFDYVYLFNDFDPTNTGGVPLPANTSYLYFSNRLTYVSNQRKRIFYNITARFGEYFNGRFVQWQSTANLRLQPYAVLSLDANYTRIRLPEPYSDADIWLVGPRLDITFNRELFLTTFFQYNTQVNNININARFQWRFRPVSDLFLVYTDNYFATADMDDNNQLVQPWQPKNRAVVLKFTYWLNL